MLTHLQLRDFVIVDAAELDFARGLTALTGETGAGKSIVVDALLAIAGGRGGADSVRQGAERAEVAAGFALLPAEARAWLDAQAIEHDDEVIVRRVIGSDGRSRAYINGQLVPIQQLREFTEWLIEIHGQQEFQHLVKRGAQRAMLDEHLGDPALTQAVAQLSIAARACRREYEDLKSAAEHRESRLELRRHELAELEAHVTTVGAIEELYVEQKRLAGRGRLSAAAQTALTALYEADAGSAHDLLAKAGAALRSVGDTDPALGAPAELLAEAGVLVQEAAVALRRYLDDLEVDPGRQEELERHAAALEALARKHRCGVLDLPAHLARTLREVLDLENAEVSLAALDRRRTLIEADYRAAAERLTAGRRAACEVLGEHITGLMQTLGMAGGRFAVSLQSTEADFGPHGHDDIEFQVSANPGQPLKSLAKVASGGELSRISLAVQVAAAGKSAAMCMVFDEVDAGIGGAIAEIVGRQLRELGAGSQVLCVTHLAQVAAQAHTQFRVIKQTGPVTRTIVDKLGPDERVEEIARMLGGVDITQQARAHAREMLSGTARAAPGAVAAQAPTAPASAAASASTRRATPAAAPGAVAAQAPTAPASAAASASTRRATPAAAAGKKRRPE